MKFCGFFFGNSYKNTDIMLMAKLQINKPMHEKWNSLICTLETDDLYGEKNGKKKEKKRKKTSL